VFKLIKYDRNRLLNNIIFLAKEKNIRIGDLESRVGVSAGYFSRLNKKDSTASPSIEVITATADFLEIPIDILIACPFDGLSITEKYLIDFIDVIIENTRTEKIVWNCTSKEEFFADFNPDHDQHDLFYNNEIDPIDGYPRYKSAFREGLYVNPCDDFLTVTLQENGTLWLVKVKVEGIGVEYELYLYNGDTFSPLCHTTANNSESPFNSVLQTLHQNAQISSTLPKIDSKTRSIIDDYMRFNDLPF
jgi:transcriptional regulator with XRE-family HTH domain